MESIAQEYGLDIGRFMADHQGKWVIQGGFEGFGYRAQRRDGDGRGRGPWIEDLTLDELAGKLATP
jgi:hypothetical protein